MPEVLVIGGTALRPRSDDVYVRMVIRASERVVEIVVLRSEQQGRLAG